MRILLAICFTILLSGCQDSVQQTPAQSSKLSPSQQAAVTTEMQQLRDIAARYDQQKENELGQYINRIGRNETKWTPDQKATIIRWATPLYTTTLAMIDDFNRQQPTTTDGIDAKDTYVRGFSNSKIWLFTLLQDAGATPQQ